MNEAVGFAVLHPPYACVEGKSQMPMGGRPKAPAGFEFEAFNIV